MRGPGPSLSSASTSSRAARRRQSAGRGDTAVVAPARAPGPGAGRDLLSRRELLRGAGLALGALVLLPRHARPHEGHEGGFHLPQITTEALDASTFVYISPLHPGGEESRCHGEVWYFHDGGDAVIATGKDTWKARALRKGWDGARVWVGDFGPVRRAGERYRGAPSFAARAELDGDSAVFERLLASFGQKYPAEWDRWEPRFRESYADGSRIVIRYRPVGA